MLAQTTLFVALLATLALGILTTNLIAADVTRQHAISRYATIASDDAVENFTLLMQSYVREHGTEGPWPLQIPASRPIALCPQTGGNGACPYSYVATAKITGASSANAPAQTGIAVLGNDRAENLQKFLIDEERVSATVTATVSDSGGIVATGTRYVTMRVMGGTPYAMVGGQRSIDAANGSTSGIEGDNGGVPRDPKSNFVAPRPNASDPAEYRDTEITAVLDCTNVDAIVGGDTPHPSHDQGRGNRSLAWGVGTGGGYELPCTDTFATSPPGTFVDEGWSNGNADRGASQ